MAYLGQAPINGFHAKQSLTGDGSTVTFTLDQTCATETSMIVSVGGVIQEPSTAYDLVQGGTKITFTEAPVSTDRIYIHFLGKAIVQNTLDIAGVEFILDADNDTSFTADTDDEIDIKVGGTDRSTIKATGFHNIDNVKFVAGAGDDLEIYHDGTNSLIANKTGALKVATETSGIAVTIGHTTSEVTIADNATVAGNLTVTGTLTQTGTQTFDGGIDVDNFNINGTTIALSSGDMVLDSAGDIILDAGGADIVFKDDGTTIATHLNSSSDYVIQTAVSDKDFIIKGNDGGSTITPLTLDMSAGGDMFLTGGLIDLKNDGTAVSQIKFYCESSNAHAQTLIGAPHAQSATNTLTLPDGSNGVLLSTVSTATVTNKTFTSPKINEDVAVTSTATELNFNDGVTLGTAIASKVVTTDANIDITGGRNITISGELDAATGDFSGVVDVAGAFTTGSTIVSTGAITSSGLITGTGFTAGSAVLAEAELELLDGLTAGTAIASKVVTTDSDIDTTGQRNLTISGELDAATGDFSGAVDIAGQFTVGDGSAGAPSISNTGDTNTGLLFSAADTLAFSAGGTAQFTMADGLIAPVTDKDVDLGTNSLQFKNVHVNGTTFTDAIGFGTVVMTLPTADGDADQILTTDGSGTLAFVDNSGGTSWVAVKTGAYTASAGEGVFANTSSSAWTLTLPAGSIGDEISFIDYAGTFDTNALTIAANGSEKILGSTDDLTVTVERAANTLVFTDGTQGWLLKSK